MYPYILKTRSIQWHYCRALRAGGWCLALGLLALAAGCTSKSGGGAEFAEVSGRVLFNGEPLPGGKITFITVGGANAQSAAIDENGNYKLQAPVGDVQIAVDNRMVGKHTEAPTRAVQKKGAGRPPGPTHGEEPAPIEIKGTYKKIPDKYYTPSQSGLTWKVEKGGGKHDIELQ